MLKQSNIIKCIDNFIQYYKPEFEKIIKSKLDEIAKTLINEQASIEKTGDNMKVDFKRNLKKFKETTTVYFKRNYYFISQKYILNEINNNVLKKLIKNYRKKLDIKNILENNNNNNIIINLQNCFLEKLKNFALENNINIDIKLSNVFKNIDMNTTMKYLLVYRHIISKITSDEIFEEIYLKKLNNITNIINNENLNFCKIKYLTIVVIGETGVGKSTLINSVLKVDKALTGPGKQVTIKNNLYNFELIPFLRLYDTRGIELKTEFGPENILNNALEIINTSEKGKDFNNFVNCIWYCVKDINIEDKEIDIIRSLRNQKKNIPLIIVYSFAIIQEGFKNIRSKISQEFPDAIFLPVLAKKSDNNNSFGLDELVEKTIEVCKKDIIHGKIFDSMKKEISKYILDYFKKEHETLKKKINCFIANDFVNNFTKVLNDEQLYNYIYNMIESLFIEFLKINDVFDKKDLNIKNSLKKIIIFRRIPWKVY